MKKVLKVAGIILIVLMLVGFAGAAYIKLILPNTVYEPYLKIEKTPQRVARGRYLANHVAVCMDCHSTRNWGLYAGPIAGKQVGGGGEVFDDGHCILQLSLRQNKL